MKNTNGVFLSIHRISFEQIKALSLCFGPGYFVQPDKEYYYVVHVDSLPDISLSFFSVALDIEQRNELTIEE